MRGNQRDAIGRAATVAGAALAGLLCARGSAAREGADKSAFHLFNPTPRSQMRDMSTDRPDTTESPYTVDAGHFQAELSFVEYARGDDGGEAWDVAPINLKLGLLNNVDAQFVLSPYSDVSAHDEPHAAGFGDAQLRVKVNVWGNDGGDTVLAVMPFVQFPTGENDLTGGHAAYGLIVPFLMSIDDRTALTLMAEADVLRDEENDGWDTYLLHTASVGRDLSDLFGAYVEYIGVLPLGGGDADYQALIGTGMTYAVTEDVQLDAGVNVGLTDNAEDVRFFAGISFRL